MALRYSVVELTLDAGASDTFEVDVRAGERFESISCLGTGADAISNTKFSLKINDVDRIAPYISLEALGKTQDQSLPMNYEFTEAGKLKGTVINNESAGRTVRVAFRIKLPE